MLGPLVIPTICSTGNRRETSQCERHEKYMYNFFLNLLKLCPRIRSGVLQGYVMLARVRLGQVNLVTFHFLKLYWSKKKVVHIVASGNDWFRRLRKPCSQILLFSDHRSQGSLLPKEVDYLTNLGCTYYPSTIPPGGSI